MFIAIEWLEKGQPRRVQFNRKADAITWCTKYAPELLPQLR